MFYSAQILSKKGPLATTWLAAHLERRLGRQQVFETSIPSTIDAIVNPEAPLALRLSGQLLLGLVRIYGRKVVYLEKDCTDAITKLREVHTQQLASTDKQLAPLEAITLPGDVFLSFELFPDDGTDAFEASEPSRSGRASIGSARDSLLLVDGLSGLSGSQNLLRHEEFDVAGEEVERALMQTPERARYAFDARGVRTPELPKGGIGDEAVSEPHMPHSTAPPAAADLDDPLLLEEPPAWEQEELNMAPQDMDFELRNEGQEQPGVTADTESGGYAAAADAAASADARRAAAGTAEPSRAASGAARRGARRRALPMDTEEQELAREEVRALLMNTAPLLRNRVGGSPSPSDRTVGAVLSQLVVAGLENEPLPRLHRATHADEPPLAPALLRLLDACHQAAPLQLCAFGKDPVEGNVAKVAAAAAGGRQRRKQMQLSCDAAEEQAPQAELQDGAEAGAAALEPQGDAVGLDPQYEMDLPLDDGMELSATPGGDAAAPHPAASPPPAGRAAAEEAPATPAPAEQVPQVAADVVSMFRDVDATQLEEEQLDADAAAGVGFSTRTLRVLSHLQNVLQVSCMAAGQNRLDAARCFFEMLVLNAKGYVQLQQSEPYGEIGVIPQSAMPVPSCTAAAQSRSPSSKARRASSVPSVATTPPALAAIQA